MPETQATAVILGRSDVDQCPTNALVVAFPSVAYAQASQLFHQRVREPVGIHDSAVLDRNRVELGSEIRIGPNAVVADGAQLGDRVELQAGAYVGHGASIGSDSVVMAGAVLYHDVELGERCVIHSGAVIGADGFGFIPDERGEIHTVAQLGSVTVGDDVVVGASTTIDRGAIENTTIGNGVKIDNQVQIGHNLPDRRQHADLRLRWT